MVRQLITTMVKKYQSLVAGDQQAALFGQACFERGDVKTHMELVASC